MKTGRFLREARKSGLITQDGPQISEKELQFLPWAIADWLPTFWSKRSVGIVLISLIIGTASCFFPVIWEIASASATAWVWVLGSLIVGFNAAILPNTLEEVRNPIVQEQYLFQGVRSILYHLIASMILCAVACVFWSLVQAETIRCWLQSIPFLPLSILSAVTLFTLDESFGVVRAKVGRVLVTITAEQYLASRD